MGSSAPTMIAARQRVPALSAVPPVLRTVIAPMLEPRPVARLIPALGLVAGHRFLTGGPLVGQGRDDVLAVCTGHGKRVIEGAPITLTVGRRHPLEEK